MKTVLITLIIASIILWLLYKTLFSKTKDDYNRDTSNYNRNAYNYDKGDQKKVNPKKSFFSSLFKNKKEIKPKAKKQNILSRIFSNPLPFDDEAITWCANFLVVDKKTLIDILRNTSIYYSNFELRKRSGGYRTISAPNKILLDLQKTIYKRILLPVKTHPSATGFRIKTSVIQNAIPHLKNKEILKIDIRNFFGSIKKEVVKDTFCKIGYPTNIAEVFAELCTLKGSLPQGAATSPTLSNIIVYEMDTELTALSNSYKLCYTRYADDMTFSGDSIAFDSFLAEVNGSMQKYKFVIQHKKTRYIRSNKRKIITGISISSGYKLTIPKSKKREVRKNVHFILSKGIVEHQKYIQSDDPSYLKRLIGYLNFWLMVEPDNEYVRKSIAALKKI